MILDAGSTILWTVALECGCLKIRKAESIWNKYHEEHQWKAFKEACNKYNRLLYFKKKQSISDEIVNCGGDTKRLYSLIKNITGQAKENPLPDYDDTDILCNEFSDFFMNKILTIRSELEKFSLFKPDKVNNNTKFKFQPLDQSTVKTAILSMKTITCELDVMPTKLQKQIIPWILEPLTLAFNTSLTSGKFPTTWKTAIVRPLLKKPNAALEFKNYRPVSNLAFLSKVLEKLAMDQVIKYCDSNNLLPVYQSAYRKYHSCETGLVKLTNDILWNMENGKVTSLCAIDLSAAFDTVDHSVLLAVLRDKCSFSEESLLWFSSYLHPRTCRVNINKNYSKDANLSFSVPQGSVAGPQLFSLYSSTLGGVVTPSGNDIHGFADDHAIKNSFVAKYQNEANSIKSFEDCLISTREWMNENRLKMNTTKTELILLGSRQQLAKCKTSSMDVCGDIVKRSKSIKYLGAHLDETLSLREFVTHKCKIATMNIYKIINVRHQLTTEACKTFMQGLVLVHLDYSNAILSGLPETDKSRLQLVQNFAAKVVLGKKKSDSSTACLRELQWLPVKVRIEYKVLLLVFKALNGMAPEYLSNLISRLPNRGYSLRSTRDNNKLLVPFNSKKTFASR